MLTDPIPVIEWRDFLTSFNRAHQGWLITLEAARPGNGLVRVMHELPLIGVFDEFERLVIAAGRQRQRVDRIVEHPISLRCARTSQGTDLGLDVETDAGEHVSLRFRSAIPPELVDGV